MEFVSNGYVVGGARVAQCNVRDISARSRMERALQEQATTLADLHTRKDEFLAMLSHELRSPLAPILNAVQLLRLQGGGALPQAEAVQIIHRQVGRLKHIVDDLLTSAAKFTLDGGHIWVTLGQEAATCVLRVRDSGVGISPEDLPRVFDLFSQSERSLDRSQGGLGIGLALAQRLVELHHGALEVTSALGMGSEFIVRLPLAHTPGLPPSTIASARPAAHTLRVLVVEDNQDTARSMAMLLELAGHEVRVAHDGATSLELALAFRPNVVLLDIGLPGLDGYKVARWMRHTLRDVVLVAVTGYAQDTDRQRAQESGFNHHLVTPADFDKVQEILAGVAQRAR